ncbi:MAG: hypothetical protein NW203_00565 [Hyphomonadaceae bacterium]|nr:hypothetical protein [Hyphomonadaceae bacterium]
MDIRALEKSIAKLATDSGIVLNKDGYAGWGPTLGDEPEVPEHVGEEKGYLLAVWPWRRLMVECINYLSINALAFQQLVRNEKFQQDLFRALCSQHVKAASDAICVLHMADHGYVAQSAVIAQSCKESMEACALFMLDPSAADVFVGAETLDEANDVWFSTIRKARKAVDKALTNLAPRDVDTADWMHHKNRLFGALKHPSHIGPMLNAYVEWEDGRTARPMLPARTLDCVTVFQTIAATCFELASIVLLAAHGRRDDTSPATATEDRPYEIAGFFEEDWLDSYASRGHKFMQNLWCFYIERQEEQPFVAWRQSRV